MKEPCKVYVYEFSSFENDEPMAFEDQNGHLHAFSWDFRIFTIFFKCYPILAVQKVF